MEALNLWFESVGISANTATPKVNEYQVSFHLPLHRYVCLQNSLMSIKPQRLGSWVTMSIQNRLTHISLSHETQQKFFL